MTIHFRSILSRVQPAKELRYLPVDGILSIFARSELLNIFYRRIGHLLILKPLHSRAISVFHLLFSCTIARHKSSGGQVRSFEVWSGTFRWCQVDVRVFRFGWNLKRGKFFFVIECQPLIVGLLLVPSSMFDWDM